MKAMGSAERIAILLAAATIGCCCARAQDAGTVVDSNAYPLGVQQVLQSARDACKSEGGGNVTFAPDTVRALHLTGDGRDVYIVDFHNARCQDRDGGYCGGHGVPSCFKMRHITTQPFKFTMPR